MRNPELWKPTQFVLRRGRLRASTDRQVRAVASRLALDRTAAVHPLAYFLVAERRA
jgi:hypothetical protein